MFVAISLGWGVQSFTLAAMSALGVLPKVDAAIHSDTEHEYARTYEFAAQWTPWLEEHGVTVATVRNLKQRLTKVTVDNGVMIPAYTIREELRGQVHRQCTKEWKIRPLRRYLKQYRAGQKCEVWLGISTDEFQRAKDSGVQYIRHRFPLLEMGFSRQDCLDWLTSVGLPSPGKSSCVFCPFHHKAAWEELRRAGGPDWENAVAVDEAVRYARMPGECFVHNKRVPLVDAIVLPERATSVTAIQLLESDDFDAECDSGHCFL